MTASKAPAKRQGNPRTQRHVKPVPAPADPSVPDVLGQVGRSYWVELSDLGSDFYTETDQVALLDYCKLRDVEAELEAMVDATGTTVRGSQGQPVANPDFKSLLEVRKEIRAAGKDLALNPRDRVNLGLAVKVGMSKLDQLRAANRVSTGS